MSLDNGSNVVHDMEPSCMNKNILILIGVGILILGLGVGSYFFLIPRCPESCDDRNPCTKDICSEETNYKCSYTKLTGPQPGCLAEVTCGKETCKVGVCQIDYILDCCDNKICEVGEVYPDCVADCPNCDDNNECTKDYYDYHEQKCVNTSILDVICCGNTVCERGETYQDCSRDCPNCDDDNKCTKDSYDYYGQKCINKTIIPCCSNEICDKDAETYLNCSTDCPNCDDNNECTEDLYDYPEQKCVNEIIVPCCGNEICDEDAEIYSSCPVDCPNCDDNNRLTADSFNYTIQKCEHIVTHYFIDDFEEGTENWVFSDETAWSTIIEDGNTVLRGTTPGDEVYAKLENKSWANYIFKVRFKIINGGMHFHYRLNPSYVAHVSDDNNVILGLEKKGEIVKQYPLDKNWHTLEIKCYGSIVNVYVDDELLIKYKYTENLPISNGVELRTMGGSGILIDDVEIKVITEKDIIYP